jgi:hypothetical protein
MAIYAAATSNDIYVRMFAYFYFWLNIPSSPSNYKTFDTDIDIFVNCNWVETRWQYTFTHKQYIEHHD